MTEPTDAHDPAAPACRYVVTGNPVEHSRSPMIHRLFAEQTGERIEYGRLLAPVDGFVATVNAFALAGGVGSNVTVPFKFEALQASTYRSPRAALAMAANWLAFGSGGWSADNTDGAGLVRDIQVNARRGVSGRRVLIIGAGGGAAGILGPLIETRPAAIVVVNRTLDKAQRLVSRHAALATHHLVDLRAGALGADHQGFHMADARDAFDIVINATSTSLNGAPIPVPGSVVARGGLAMDLMYGPPAAGFLAWAAANGAEGRDGLGMLVEQAGEAFWLWRGVRPDTAPVLRELQSSVGTS